MKIYQQLLENDREKLPPRSKTSVMVGISGPGPGKILSSGIVPSRIFSSPVHGSDLILHITIAGNSLHSITHVPYNCA